jgi:endonuclease/exonuclease/phosphatase family metal-dependent hydrolase
VLSTYPIESDDDYALSYDRSVARIAVIVNGIRVNVYSTHLDADSSSRRTTQMKQLIAWATTIRDSGSSQATSTRGRAPRRFQS